LALLTQTLLEAPIIEIDTIDSTNNYAMHLIDAEKAIPGTTIIARRQTQGKGQRGRLWQSAHGESLLMSVICNPNFTLEEQFLFNAALTLSIVRVLREQPLGQDVWIKWPNDIIINDKKAGGILVENILRGSSWTYSVIGLGLNVLQTHFPPELPFATSLKLASGRDLVVADLFIGIRAGLLQTLGGFPDKSGILQGYNELLYKRGAFQKFTDNITDWTALVKFVEPGGQLRVELEDGRTRSYNHGAVHWVWE
jgi:BirA family transcriptional regulator, biotin operon repressor / biotin---[acetyl-CoA-carboxylase] ligase